MRASIFVAVHTNAESSLLEKPQGSGDMNGQTPIYDAAVLYPDCE